MFDKILICLCDTSKNSCYQKTICNYSEKLQSRVHLYKSFGTKGSNFRENALSNRRNVLFRCCCFFLFQEIYSVGHPENSSFEKRTGEQKLFVQNGSSFCNFIHYVDNKSKGQISKQR